MYRQGSLKRSPHIHGKKGIKMEHLLILTTHIVVLDDILDNVYVKKETFWLISIGI